MVDGNDTNETFLPADAVIPEPSANLHHKVMLKIHRYERRKLIVKTTSFGVLFVGSISLLVVGYLNLMSAFAQSGFFNFASLFFSDFGSATANFQDFVFSTLESFPVFSVAFVLGGVIAVIWSASHFVQDVLEMRAHHGLAIG